MAMCQVCQTAAAVPLEALPVQQTALDSSQSDWSHVLKLLPDHVRWAVTGPARPGCKRVCCCLISACDHGAKLTAERFRVEAWTVPSRDRPRARLQHRQVCARLVAGLPAGQAVRRAQQGVAEEVDLQAARASAAAACPVLPIPVAG